MGRAEERMKRKLERNPVEECSRIQKKYCLDLFQDLEDTKDPRHLSYVEYSNHEILGTVYYKGIAGIDSMQSMNYEFNQETTAKNLSRFMGKRRGNICRTLLRSINILSGWILRSSRRCSRNRFTV